MYAYPSFADVTADGSVLVAELRKGSGMDVGTVYHAGWTVAGFAGSFLPAAPTMLAAPAWTCDVLADEIENALKAHAAAMGLAIPWATIALAVLDLLAKLLQGVQP